MLEAKVCNIDIANMLNIAPDVISDIKDGTSYSHISKTIISLRNLDKEKLLKILWKKYVRCVSMVYVMTKSVEP